MNIMNYARGLQNYFSEVMAENNYKTITTYFEDFTIAEFFGVKVIRNTYRKAFNEHKEDVHYMTEIAMVLNHKIFQHFEKRRDLAVVYDELWRECDTYCCDFFKGEDLHYYYKTTD